MNKRIPESGSSILSVLQKSKRTELSAFLGFDACIDNIARVVRQKDESGIPDYFTDSRQFADYILKRGDKSCGIELETRVSKAGGNMVITANALGNLGVKVDCAGTFGTPDILPLFRSLSENCILHTIGDTITATALEFDNNKIIIFDPGPYRDLNWATIKKIMGVERIKGLISSRQLISFLNWSEIENSTEIWLGIYDEILPHAVKPSEKKIFFTDFSDCSRKSQQEISEVLGLLGKFRKYFRVILSLNTNEAELVANASGMSYKKIDEKFVKNLYEHTRTDILVIHRTEDAVSYDGRVVEKCESFLCNNPAVLTGGGDNFNAGFCFGQLLGMNLYDSTIIANAVAGYYVKTGISPGKEDLIKFLKNL